MAWNYIVNTAGAGEIGTLTIEEAAHWAGRSDRISRVERNPDGSHAGLAPLSDAERARYFEVRRPLV